jgi:hypothetical protein
MHAMGRGLTAASLVLAGFATPQAHGAIVVTPGADTVSTPRLQLDFGDAGADVERLDSLRWITSLGVLTPNLAVSDGAGGCDSPAASRFWGEAGSVAGAPQPVGSGSTGTWAAPSGRTVQIDSSRPLLCTSDGTVTPVRTRYTFFNVGDGAGRIRVQRTFAFSASTPSYATPSMRAFVPRLALATYSNVIHPNAAGSALVSEAPTAPATPAASWNGTWFAIDDPISHAGVVVLRDPASTNPAQLMLEGDPAASSAIDLIKPAGGWKAPVTETEWLCPYDATSWPLPRSPAVLPSGCSIVAVPINTAAPVVSGTPTVATPLTATTGTWDDAASITLQWGRCVTAANCVAIPGATGPSYAPVVADEGSQLVVTATATAPGGEVDDASSARFGPVNGGVPQLLAAPVLFGQARADEVLGASHGDWSDSPGSFQYQWRRCATIAGTGCADIPGATATSYKMVRDDVGATIRVRVIAVNGSGSSVAADSAPTGEVQPFVVAAALVASPAPTCTGVTTTLDASASKTPNGPIKNYRFSYKPLSFESFLGAVFSTGPSGDATPLIDAAVAKVPAVAIYDGPSPRATISLTWNRQSVPAEKAFGAKPGDYVRDPVFVSVTVTDQGGATSSTHYDELDQAQIFSSQSRASCPKVRARVTKLNPARLSLTTRVVTANVLCPTVADCAGSLSVYTLKTTRSAVRAARSKRVVIASNALFTIRGKTSANVHATLTAAGRALARRHRPIRATVALTSIDPVTTHRTTTTRVVTLPAHKR